MRALVWHRAATPLLSGVLCLALGQACAVPAPPASVAATQSSASFVKAQRKAGHGPKHLIFLDPAEASEASAALALTPAQVVIVRHGEKPSNGPDLNKRGQKRAQGMVDYFENDPTMAQYGEPAAIYAMAQHHPDTSARAIETVKPLADDLGQSVLDDYRRDDYQSMVDEIMKSPSYDGQTVIVCWEHNVIPSIAQSFGAKAPSSWDSGSTYDRTWVVSFAADGSTSFQDLPQGILPGDSTTSGSNGNVVLSINSDAATSGAVATE